MTLQYKPKPGIKFPGFIFPPKVALSKKDNFVRQLPIKGPLFYKEDQKKAGTPRKESRPAGTTKFQGTRLFPLALLFFLVLAVFRLQVFSWLLPRA